MPEQQNKTMNDYYVHRRSKTKTKQKTVVENMKSCACDRFTRNKRTHNWLGVCVQTVIPNITLEIGNIKQKIHQFKHLL